MGDAARAPDASIASRLHRRDAAGVPRVDITLGVRAHVLADEAVLATFRRLRKPPTAEQWLRITNETEHAVARWAREGWLADPRSFHADPPLLEQPLLRESRAGLNLNAGPLPVERMKFASDWSPPPDAPGRDRWLRYSENATARATVIRHRGGPRPWVVCIHGTEMGRDADLRAFRARKLFDDLGCNLVFPILPLHGPRRVAKEAGAQFPSLDFIDNVFGLAQAASDVRRILSWIRIQQPLRIGMLGVSLGGYVAALVAGLETEPLDCVLPIIPATDFPALFRRQSPAELQALLDPVMEQASLVHSVVSPLRFAPTTPRSRRAIAAGLADKLIDPVEQVAPLWEHWDRPNIHWYSGGHVGHLVRRDLRTFIDVTLSRSGLARV
jgi:pimeloyl-ACP methyl ester carboxylesterase